ncbi:MAG: hypothetical protein EHM35_20945 [Planctomycetaceae bacterium]|nr:MAG: hypothetical protein EHM35_20945 [Planctomycetaceae bacterium]
MLDKDLKWALAILLSLVPSAPSLAAPLKPRIVVLTDISPTYTRDVIISGSDSSRATIEVPPDSAGKSFHVICEVTDTGTPRLTRYQRVIVEVKP